MKKLKIGNPLRELNIGQSAIEVSKSAIKSQPLIILAVIILLSISISFLNPRFLSARNLFMVLQQSSVTGIATMCMVILMISGGLDFSIGSIMSLTCVSIAKLVDLGYGVPFSVSIGMAIAVACGFLNGVIISKSRCAPIIITLGMLYIYHGMALTIAGGRFQSLRGHFEYLGRGKIGLLPVPVIVWAVFALLTFLLLRYTKFGRRLYAIGGNEETAYLSGINVDWHKIGAYSINGFIAGFAALVLVSRLGSVLANVGSDYALRALSAAVIGGVVFEGGRGTVGGACLGVILLGIVYNAMNILGVSSYYQSIVLGVIVVAAVVSSNIGLLRR
jgi:ribose/xylose/arabinose/galactoside ABC-type transport system permease subunit